MATELHRLCARMFMVGFPGPSPTAELGDLIEAGVYGAILFKRNIGQPGEVSALCGELKRSAGRPLILAVDQEGGRVARLRGPPFVSLPPMREIGKHPDLALAERLGRLLAFESRQSGDWRSVAER